MSIVPCKLRHFTERGYQLRGVVHVGAHDGQEIDDYLQLGMSPVWAFEANPVVAQRLAKAYADEPRVVVHDLALGETDETLDFWIPRHLHDGSDDEQSASFLRADRDSGYDWGQRDLDGRTLRVDVRRFDHYVAFEELTLFNTLVIDVQGFEKRVLRGFGDCLDAFDFLSVECSEVPIYKGGVPASKVADLLWWRGFRRDSPIVGHDDIFFIRLGL